uniref:Tetraacyldisaccharide 4'-kinase n=1 Tax=Desulfacinum infernum TaxID=35837 RepID=A0A831ZS15_9BACT
MDTLGFAALTPTYGCRAAAWRTCSREGDWVKGGARRKAEKGGPVTGRGYALWQSLWDEPAGSARRRFAIGLLSPLEALYETLRRRDQAKRLRRRRSLPGCVISVGNITLGGTGKTPAVLWIARTLHKAGFSVAVLSRGYGRRGSGVEKVRLDGPLHKNAERYGDEPVLLARRLPWAAVWVGADRRDAGMRAVAHDRPDVFVLDDGFQHVQLHRDLDLVLLDAARPTGNGRLLPAGPLREPPQALERAHAAIFVGDTENPSTAAESLRQGPLLGKPVFQARPVIGGFFQAAQADFPVPQEDLSRAPCIAVAGIARPQRFFSALEAMGVACLRRCAFPDHHRWTPKDERGLLRVVQETGARWIVTTEKDAVRLPPSLAKRAVYAAMDLDFGPDADRFRDVLLHAVRWWRRS